MRGVVAGLFCWAVLYWAVSAYEAAAQYINGPAPPVTAEQVCAKFQRFVGSSSDGHTLLSMSCRGARHDFDIHIRIN